MMERVSFKGEKVVKLSVYKYAKYSEEVSRVNLWNDNKEVWTVDSKKDYLRLVK